MSPVGDKGKGPELKNLQLLLRAVKASTSPLEVDYDELMKLEDAPNKDSLAKRLERMKTVLGLTIKGKNTVNENRLKKRKADEDKTDDADEQELTGCKKSKVKRD